MVDGWDEKLPAFVLRLNYWDHDGISQQHTEYFTTPEEAYRRYLDTKDEKGTVVAVLFKMNYQKVEL